MKRRGGSGKPRKRRHTDTAEARKALTARASVADLLKQLAQRTRERDESLEQQTATSEVLQVISSSPTDIQPVLDAILQTAGRLCESEYACFFKLQDGACHLAGSNNAKADYIKYLSEHPISVDRGTVVGRAAIERRTVHIPDCLTDPEYTAHENARIGKHRSLLGVPLLRDGLPVGVIGLLRRSVKPYTEKQIELVKNFAAQAVIAIENTRLLNELRESLQQQTATADVLKVISSSPGELTPVFQAMLAKATHLCEASYGGMWLCEGDAFRAASHHGNLPAEFVDRWRSGTLFRPSPNLPMVRAIKTRQPIQITDLRATEAYREGYPMAVVGVDVAGIRSMVAVPMFKENEPVGVMSIYRKEVRPFTDKHIELVTNFAAQAVIAIENTRLLNELRESLQQQTATADVLKVISRSTFDLPTVLQTLVESAARLCDAEKATITREKNGAFYRAESYGFSSEYMDYIKNVPIEPDRSSISGRSLVEGRAVHVADVTNDPEHKLAEAQRLGDYRTALAVPMLREGVPIGVLSLVRNEVRPFSDKQVDLVTTFADQAAIAIENVRLFDEVQARTRELSESLQQQTATADVLKVISRSAFDLKTVLRTLVESAAQLCEAQQAIVTERGDDGVYRLATSFGYPEEFDEYMRQNPLAPGRETTTGRVALEGKVVHIPDVLADPEYTFPKGQQLGGYRSNLGVPLLRDGVPIGAFVLTRTVVKAFTDKQIELVETFADQAVIAIENVRLLSELRESLQQQTATADVLKVISRSTFDLQTVLNTLTESAVRLCAADRAVIFQRDGDLYRLGANYGFSSEAGQYAAEHPLRPGRGSVIGRVALEGRAIHIPDVLADSEYTLTDYQRTFGYRTALGVPLLREGETIGTLTLTRDEVNPFTEKQIELATTFADQAVIAIENVRLFEEVQARTRELGKSLEELRTTQDRLVQTQKLALLGQLTAGIAHEIKNPLNFVNNFSGVSAEMIDELREALVDVNLSEKKRSDITELMDTLRSNFDKVVQHGKRADAIVKNMLQHSREGSGEHRVIDVNTLVEESLNLAWHGARAETQGFEIKLQQSFDPSAGGADVFPQDIRRALLNVISNGFHAASKRRAETDGGDYEPMLTASTKNLGDRVEIRIRDNGTGIAPDVKEKMFNPFFTTKPTGEGTGLGLSISHDIVVKQHGGSIEVETQPGEFTEIRVILPRTAVFV
jgi:GAF domain-containing protein